MTKLKLALISPAGTGGWRRNERALSETLHRLDVPHSVIGVTPAIRRALAIWPIGSLLVAAAARRAARRAMRSGATALLMVNSTSALLLPWRAIRRTGTRVGIRIDSPYDALRPGRAYALARRLERRALARSDVTLVAGPNARALTHPFAAKTVTCPVPVQPSAAPADGGRVGHVLAYAGQPRERGLDLLCSAWNVLGPRPDQALIVTGVSAADARRFLKRSGVDEPPLIEWAGELGELEYGALLRSATAFVSVPRLEGHGIAALEALAAGVPLVTAPALGAHEAAPLAHEAHPGLVAETREPQAVAAALAAALALDAGARERYSESARALVASHSEAEADRGMAQALAALGRGAG